MNTSIERTNKIYIVGTLIQVKDERDGDINGIPWKAGTAVIKSGENEIELKYFSSKLTKAGKSNSKYMNYVTLGDKVGKKVKVNGELTGRVWFNQKTNQNITFNEISAGFFNDAKPSDKDVATFEFGGFVTKPLHERMNKDEEVISYEMELGQAKYGGETMQIVKFAVDPSDNNVISAIQSKYTKDATILISGVIEYKVIVEEKVEKVAFGDPIVKKFTTTRKAFLITGGKEVITEENQAYSVEDITKLTSSYSDYLTQVEKDAKDNMKGTSTQNNAPAVSNIQKSLL